MGKTAPKEEEAEGSPKNKTARVDDAAPITASAASPTRKTPPKGDGAEESPRKKAPRLSGVNLPGASETNPTGKTPPKEKAEGSSPKTPRSPRNTSPSGQHKLPAAAVPLSTVPDESSELIVKGVARASDKKRCNCNHVITDSAFDEVRDMEVVIQFLESKDALLCYGCSEEDKDGIVKTRPEKSDLLICVKCKDHLCCGVGSIAYPYGHSRAHARNEEHWLAVLCCDPPRGYCFKCNAEVSKLVKFGSRKLLAPTPSVGPTEAAVNPEKVKMSGKVQAESHPSGCKSSDAQGYAIRGITNLGNTCYMSAVLQCLFVLGKLRERMLADHPKGLLPEVLKELFVEASAAGDVLDPTEVLSIVGFGRDPYFHVGSMEDSHEFLTLLRDIWIKSEKSYDSQAPTVIDSIFEFHMLRTVSCKKCGLSMKPDTCKDLTMNFPPKWHPTKSAASPQSESPQSRKREIPLQLLPADVQRNLEKMQTVSESGYSHLIGSDVIVENMHKPLEVDSTQAQHISQSKDVVQSPLQIQDGKSIDSLTEGSLSIEDFLLPVQVRCDKCSKDHEEPSASQSKNGEQIVGRGNEDDVGDAVETLCFVTLPPVLILHVNRTYYPMGSSKVEQKSGIKISGHVTFEEYLDVKPFMDTSFAHEGSSCYRLAGVVEHIGKGSLKEKDGHYIAYVRARRLGNQQESTSCSSSWFCADDRKIIQVTLEKVLKTEVYILFYERTEETPGMPDDILSRWEVITSDEIVNCNSDLEDPCFVYEKKFENTPWRSKILHSKYTDYICNIVDNNMGRLERLQVAAEWAGQFAFVADSILPIPVCSLSVKASSHISQARRTSAMIGRTFEFLKSAIPPPDRFVVIGVANQAQARYAVSMWDDASRPKWYCVEIVDLNEACAVKKVLDQLDAMRLLWWYHPNL